MINSNIEDIMDLAIVDSGATSYFFVTYVSATGIPLATHPITLTIPDGSKLTSTSKRELDLPQLPQMARTRQLFQECHYTQLCLLSHYEIQDTG